MVSIIEPATQCPSKNFTLHLSKVFLDFSQMRWFKNINFGLLILALGFFKF